MYSIHRRRFILAQKRWHTVTIWATSATEHAPLATEAQTDWLSQNKITSL